MSNPRRDIDGLRERFQKNCDSLVEKLKTEYKVNSELLQALKQRLESGVNGMALNNSDMNKILNSDASIKKLGPELIKALNKDLSELCQLNNQIRMGNKAEKAAEQTQTVENKARARGPKY